MTNKRHNLHDLSYKKIFNHKQMVESLLRDFAQVDDIIDSLDFSTLRRCSGDLVADGFMERHSDMIWEVQLKDGSPCYVYLLLEFQSSTDRTMPMRVLAYMALFLLELMQKNPSAPLPPILPIVMYNGQDKWTPPQDVASLYGNVPESLKQYIPQQRYFLLDEKHIPPSKLEKSKGLVAQVIKSEQADDLDDFQTIVEEWIKLTIGQEHNDLQRDIAEWLRRVIAKNCNLEGEEITVLENLHNLQEVKSMLEANVQGWKAKYIALGRTEGRSEGRAEGRSEGRAEGARESLLKILNFRFGQLPDNVMSTISNMPDNNLLSKLQDSALTQEYSLQDFMEFLPRDIAKC